MFRRRASVTGGCGFAVVIALALPVTASADRDFASRFSAQVPGNVTMAANTLMTCSAAESGCAAARDDTSIGNTVNSSLNNNQWTMVNINVSGNPALANASKARLSLPAGAQVLFAGLYWVANAPSGLTAARAKAVKFRGPDGALVDVTASVYDPAPTVDLGYACFADVTAAVQAQGAGEYMVGDVATRPNSRNVGAGWSLVVAYQAPGEPLRDLSIFDGQRSVSGSNLISIPITGFRTPATGTVRSDVGIVAFEGDRGVRGDYAQLDDTVLGDALTPQLNFFNSWIEIKGAPAPGRVPAQGNAFGFDSKIVAANGVLRNNATSAVIRAKTSGEGYQAVVATFATDLYAPNLVVTKSVKDLNGGEARIGDELEYALTITNTGGDGAIGSDIVENSMPPGTAFVSGSMSYDSASVADSGDPRGEAAGGSGPLTMRLGTGVSATGGGRIGPGETHTVRFRVRIDAIPPGGGVISNRAAVDYMAETLGTPVTALSPKADIRVNVPDAAVVKTISSSHFANGLMAQYRIQVSNRGTASTGGTTTVTDELPSAFLSSPTASGSGWNCLPIVSGHVTCSRSDALAPGGFYPPILVTVSKLDDPSGATVSNTAHVTTPLDGDATNDQSTIENVVGDGYAVIPVAVNALKPAVWPGEDVGVTGFFTNNGPSAAITPVLTLVSGSAVDEVPVTGFTVTSSNGSVTTGDCQGRVRSDRRYEVVCDPSRLGDGVTVEITINFRPSPGTSLESFDVDGTSDADNRSGPPGSAGDTVLIRATADLNVKKYVDKPSAQPGTNVRYGILITNDGPRRTGSPISFNDVVPAGLPVSGASWNLFPDGSPAPCTVSGSAVSCSIDALDPGDSAVVFIDTVVAPNASGPYLNCAMATSSVRDPLPDNSTDCAGFTALPWAGLNLEKTGPTSLRPGGSGDYQLTLTNNGPSEAADARIVDTLPKGISAVAPLPSDCSVSGQKVTCEVGSLAPEQSVVRVIKVRAASTLQPGTRLRNVATATSSTPGDSAEASDVVPITIVGIGTRITAPRRSQRLGSSFRLRVSVKAEEVDVKDPRVCATLPPNVAYLSSSGSRSGNRVCWRLGNLGANLSRWFSINVRAAAVGQRRASSSARGVGTRTASDSTLVRVVGGFTG